MERRTFLQTLAALPLGAPFASALAQSSVPIHVVKFLLFTCPICRSAEGVDPALRAAALQTGGKFIQAPLPMDEDYAAQFYYAAREMIPALEPKVRLSLYKGVQDMGIPMNDPFRVLIWLQQDLGEERDVNWSSLMAFASGDEVLGAVSRASRLAGSMGVSNTPSYVLVADQRPSALLDPLTVSPANSLSALREAVIKKVNELHTK